MARGKPKSKNNHRHENREGWVNNSVPCVHFELADRESEDKPAAAKWAWAQLEYLAEAFCEMYCSRTICDVYREIQKRLGIKENPVDIKKWHSVQRSFHEALSFFPELREATEECPACSVVRALSCFPDMLMFHELHSVKKWQMERDGVVSPNKLSSKGAIPCFAFEEEMECSATQNVVVKERALLEFATDKLPPLYPNMGEMVSKTLTKARAVVVAIDKLLGADMTAGTHDETRTVREKMIEVDLREKKGDGWYWIVNGVERTRIADKSSRKICIISQILFDNIGTGRFVPYKTFCNAIGWSEEEYFGKKSEDSGKKLEKGRMNRQLDILRKNLGIEIEFDEKGVRFPSNVVKARKRPS